VFLFVVWGLLSSVLSQKNVSEMTYSAFGGT